MYGPVRTVVWQGSAGDRRPYADRAAATVGAVYDVYDRPKLRMIPFHQSPLI